MNKFINAEQALSLSKKNKQKQMEYYLDNIERDRKANTIKREIEKGNVNISNSEGSGAYGLLQLMRSSHGSVSSQVDEAVQLYKAQGMNAWSQTAY